MNSLKANSTPSANTTSVAPKAANNVAPPKAANNVAAPKAANNVATPKAANNANVKAPESLAPPTTIAGKTKATFSNIKNKIGNYFKENKTTGQIIIIVVVCLALTLTIIGIRSLIVHMYKTSKQKPWLVKGSKNAKNSLVISQDPEDKNSVSINRSSDKEDGIEFTYSLWMLVENYIYKKNEWKHVFHKGNSTSYPNRAPGVWLHPNENSIRVYMNTYSNILEYVDIENIPIKKWLHLGIVLRQKVLNIYINGTLKKRQVLSSLPRQNFGDLWVNLYGGYEGYLSRMRYYQYALEYDQLEEIVKEGPSLKTCTDSGELPPYLNDTWWYNN